MCKQRIDDNKKCRQIAGNFDCYPGAAVQCGVHCPMEHIQGFTQSHWMPPSVECLPGIAPVAAMVGEFVENTQNTTKKPLATVMVGHKHQKGNTFLLLRW